MEQYWNILESLESNNVCHRLASAMLRIISHLNSSHRKVRWGPHAIHFRYTSCVLSLHFCDLLLIRCESLAECQNSHHLPLRRLSRAKKSLFLAEYPFLVFLGDLWSLFFDVIWCHLMSFDVIWCLCLWQCSQNSSRNSSQCHTCAGHNLAAAPSGTVKSFKSLKSQCNSGFWTEREGKCPKGTEKGKRCRGKHESQVDYIFKI